MSSCIFTPMGCSRGVYLIAELSRMELYPPIEVLNDIFLLEPGVPAVLKG